MAVTVRAVLALTCGSSVHGPIGRLSWLLRNELFLGGLLILLTGRARERPRIRGFEVDNVAREDLPLVQLVAPDNDRLEGERTFAEPADHGLTSGLDASRDRNLALARQQRH